MEKTPLRVCRICGLEARTTEDLDKFHLQKGVPYGRGNWCKKCRTTYMRNKQRTNFDGLIKCKICGTKLHRIDGNHLKGYTCQLIQKQTRLKIFNITEYKTFFPNAKMVSDHQFEVCSNAGKIGGKVTMSKLTPEEKIANGKRLGKWYVENTPREKIIAWGRKYAKIGGSLGGKACWDNMSADEFERRSIEWKERFREYWDSLSDDEKSAHGRRGALVALKNMQSPNKKELYLKELLEPYGFKWNENVFRIVDYSNILKRKRAMVPDFVHDIYPILIEYDGDGGHNPNRGWVPENQPLLDDERDGLYRKNGYKVLRLTKKDFKKGDNHIVTLVETIIKN